MDNLVKGMLKTTMVSQGTQIDESLLKQGPQSMKNTSVSKNENSFMVGNTSRSHISKVDDPLKRSGANKEDL
jgi:hypothetical protein